VRKEGELKNKIVTTEMQALRAQMSPHFIFNCLNSINRFIVKNESEAASGYLTKFSRLIRMVLNNSQKNIIPLSDELDCLELYIQMERLRLKNFFTYEVKYDDEIEIEEIMIPPLLLQPFVENAIWHGLMHKEEGGATLNIDIIQKNGVLYFRITDNGIGREKRKKKICRFETYRRKNETF
jgi:LytS/YehU family sensor histidine kinase